MLLGLALALTLAAAPADALKTAADHLAKGQLDEVFFALEGKTFEGADAQQATALLAKAGRASLKKKDPILAIQFGESALKLDKQSGEVHELLARAYKAQQQFGPSEEHADRWLSLASDSGAEIQPLITPPSVIAARLFRGQLALEQGDWELALGMASALKGEKLARDQKQLVDLIGRQAKKELAERSAGLSTAKALENRLEHALADAKRLEARSRRMGRVEPAAASSDRVVLYSTSWCGYCDKAKALLRRLNVSFVEKDIEKDPAAAQELAQKGARAGVQPRGVPVLDIRGKLVLGYNEERIRQLVR